MVCARREDAPIDRLGFGEPPGLMQLDAFAEERGDIDLERRASRQAAGLCACGTNHDRDLSLWR
jgi:hypothetical protein